MQKKLSVIIVSYNASDILLHCIESILKYNDIGSELEIIISDNSPGLDLFNLVKERYQDIKIIHNQKNLGFGYGNNQGEMIATGEYLLFLNPDTVLIEPLFSWAINQFDHNPKLGMFGVKLLKPDYTLNNSFMLLDTFGMKAWIFNKLLLKTDIFVEKKMFTSGADIYIRKSVFEKIGKFDENIFMYYEESDLLRRIVKEDSTLEVKYFPQRKIIHLEGGTKEVGKKSIKSYERQLNTFKYYCEKHGVNFKKAIKSEVILYSLQKEKYKIAGQVDKYDTECEIINVAKKALELEKTLTD